MVCICKIPLPVLCPYVPPHPTPPACYPTLPKNFLATPTTPLPSMEQTFFDIESRSRNTDGRSPVRSRFNSTIVTVPVDVHEKICKIVSLLSQALVLALSLVKAMMCTQQVPGNNRIEHMLEEEQLILQEPEQLDLPEPANRNR